MLEVLARIRHRRTRRQLSPYLDGVLSARESSRLEAHLAQCQACRDELAELRATIQTLAELPLADAPRSFALTAAPRQVEALRPAAGRLEFGLRLAMAVGVFVLAAIVVSDLLGVPGGEKEQGPMAARVELQAAPTEPGVAEKSQQLPSATGEDNAVTEAPALAGAGGEATAGPTAPSFSGYGQGEAPVETPPAETPSSQPPVLTSEPQPGFSQPSTPSATAPPAANATAAATATPAAAAEGSPATGLGSTPQVVETPAAGPASTPGAAEAPEATAPAEAPVVAAPGTAAATPTPPPMGAQLAPSESEQQVLADAEREELAAGEGGSSRETAVRWLEIGLGAGLALLFVSWFLARRRGQA